MTFFGWTILSLVIVVGEVKIILDFGRWRFRKGRDEGFAEGFRKGRREADNWWCGVEQEIEAEKLRQKIRRVK